jgi:transcriptional regulator with XRE-family HTH domain
MKNKGKERPPYADLGERLRERRKALQADEALPDDLKKIAERCGVSVTSFQMWERGNTWPKQKRQKRVAEVFKWTVTELNDQMGVKGLSPEAEAMLYSFKRLSVERQRALQALADADEATWKALTGLFSILSGENSIKTRR